MYRFRERVANAFGGHTRNLRDRQVNDAALVRIEWPELLIQPGLFHLFRKKLRHLPQLDVLALPVLERVYKDAPVVGEASTVCHVHHMLQRFERLSSMTDEELGLAAGDVDARSVRRLLEIDRGGDAERRCEPVQELDDGVGCISHSSLAAFAVTRSRLWPLLFFRRRLA